MNYCKIKQILKEDIDIYKEKQGATKYRPIWEDLLKKAKKGEYKLILVFRLDRAWRSSRQFIMDYDNLQSREITVISVMEGLDPTTPMGKAIMTIIVALAELEKTNISEATKDRLQALKNMGKKLSRPKGRKDSIKRKNIGYLLRKAKKGGDRNLVEKYQELQ